MKRIGAIVVLAALAGCANQAREGGQTSAPPQVAVAATPTVQRPTPTAKPAEPMGDIRAVEPSRDGTLVAVGTLNHGPKITGFVLLLDAKTKGALKWPVAGGVTDFAFSHDGKMLAVAGADKISLWQLPSGRLLHKAAVETGGGQFSIICDFSPDGKTLAVSNGGILMYDVARWKLKQHRLRLGPHGFVSSVKFSPDGKLLATTHYDTDEGINVWNLRTGKSQLSVHGDGGGPLLFSPDGRLLAGRIAASSSDGTKVWNVRTGKVVQTFDARKTTYESSVPQAFSPDNRILAGQDVKTGHIELWDVRTGKLLRTLLQSESVAFWADRQTLVVYDQNGVQRLHVNL